jgi:hypothetical protein
VELPASKEFVMSRQFGGFANYGYKKDREDHGMPDITDLHHKFKLVTLPRSVDYRDQVLAGPGIMDQGQVGSCVGHATDGACETRLIIAGTPISHRSPVWVYDVARCIERARVNVGVPNQELPPLEDIGSMPSDAWTGIAKWGVAAYEDRPTSNRTANDEPKLGLVESASELILTGAFRIDSTGSSRIAAMKTALANGFPIAIAIQVDAAFEMWDGVNPIGAPDPRAILGGHYIYVTKYETLSNGKVVFGGPNSWNIDWGDGGFWLGDESFIAGAEDIYAADVKVAT